MAVYYCGVLASIMIYLTIDLFKKKKSFIKLFLSLLPLLIISAIRYDVGWDYIDIYTNGFIMIGKGYMPYYFSEKPFDYLVKIIYNLSNANPNVLFIVCSIITFIFLSLAIRDQSKNVVLSIIFLFMIRYYFLTLNIVRQGIAMSILLYSLKYLKEKKYKRYILFVLLASCFHQLSLIYIPLIYVYNINFKKKKSYALILIYGLMVAVAFFLIMKYTKYGKYVNSKFNGHQLLIHELILETVLLFMCFYNKKNINFNEGYEKIYLMFLLISFIVSSLAFVIPVADRITWYFYLTDIFLIPILINKTKNRKEKMLFLVVLFTITSITIYMQTAIGDSYSILPYKTIFNK